MLYIVYGGGRVVQWCWVNFQCRASYSLDYSRARAFCACSRCGWGLFGHFYSHLSFLSSFSLSLGTARYRLKYCLKGPINPKLTNQPNTLCRKLHFAYCFGFSAPLPLPKFFYIRFRFFVKIHLLESSQLEL